MVSVVIPTYNAGKSIGAALGTVFDQDYRPIEVIVVDDGSTDATAKIVQQFDAAIAPRGLRSGEPIFRGGKSESGEAGGFSVRYFYQDNSGPSKARNTGIKLATGKFIAFLDADDTWEPDKTSRQVDVLLNHPEVDLVFTNARVFRRKGSTAVNETAVFDNYQLIAGKPGPGPLVEKAVSKLVQGNFVTTSSVLARRCCFDDRMVFNENRRHAEDWELWLQLAVRHKFGCVCRICVHKYEVGSGLSANSDKMLTSEMEVLSRFVAENRERILSEMPENTLSNHLAERFRWAGYRLMLNKEYRPAGVYFRRSLKEVRHMRTLAYMIRNLLAEKLRDLRGSFFQKG